MRSDNITDEFLNALTNLVKQIDDGIADVKYDFDECWIEVYYKADVQDYCIYCPMVDVDNAYSCFDLAYDTLVGLFY